MALRLSLAAAFGILLLAWGCSGPVGLDADSAGRVPTYQPGLPYVDLEPVTSIRDGQVGLEVYASIPPNTLVFTRTDSSLAALYDLTIRVLDARGRSAEAIQTVTDTLVAENLAATHSLDRVQHGMWFPLDPGRYLVEARLEDWHTGEHAVRQQRVDVVDPEATGPWLGRPLLYAQDEAFPIIAFHVPAGEGTRYLTTPYRDLPLDSVTEVGLFRLAADTTVAFPPFWLSATRGSLAYRGVDDDLTRADTVLFKREHIGGRGEAHAVPLPDLAPGVYRFEVTVRSDTDEELVSNSRPISVQPSGFPRVTTLDELVEALDYIAYPREVDFIQAGASLRERRARFDAFWGALVSDRRVAANLLRTYYERIEEANLRFSSVKPGWKTDRGMIFVVFGAPTYVEQTFGGEIWHYGYAEQDAATAFTFERSTYGRTSAPLEHLILVRRPIYEQAWNRAIERWRRGNVR